MILEVLALSVIFYFLLGYRIPWRKYNRYKPRRFYNPDPNSEYDSSSTRDSYTYSQEQMLDRNEELREHFPDRNVDYYSDGSIDWDKVSEDNHYMESRLD